MKVIKNLWMIYLVFWFNDDIISICVVNEKENILTIKGQDDAVTEINISIDNNGNTING